MSVINGFFIVVILSFINNIQATDIIQAIKIKPEDSEVFYNLATVYSLLERYDIATDAL